MYALIYTALLTIITYPVIQAGALPDFLKKPIQGDQQLFIDIREQKTEQLQKLQLESVKFEEESSASILKINNEISSLNNSLTNVEILIKNNLEDPFLSNIVSILRELILTLNETIQLRETIKTTTRDIIVYLKQYLDDPQYVDFKKQHDLAERLIYSFSDLMRFYNGIAIQEHLVAQLVEQEKSVKAERDSRKQAVQSIIDEHTHMKQSLEELLISLSANQSTGQSALLDKKRFEEATRYMEQLFFAKKELESLRSFEVQRKLLLVQTKLFVERSRFDHLKKLLPIVKNGIKITEIDIAYEKEMLAQEKVSYLAAKEQLQAERNRLALDQKNIETSLLLLSKERDIPLGKDLDEWTREPLQTPQGYVSWAEVGALSMKNLLLKREVEHYQVLLQLEEVKFAARSIQVKAQEIYYKVVEHKFYSEEELSLELETYRHQKVEFNSIVVQQKEQVSVAADQLGHIKKAAEALKSWQETVVNLKDIVFKGHDVEYKKVIELLKNGSNDVLKRIDLLGQITGSHSAIMTEGINIVRLIDFISIELQPSGIWYRPEYAITWSGVQNIGFDIKGFFSDIKTYMVRVQSTQLSTHIDLMFNSRWGTILFVLKLLLLLVVLFFVYQYSSILSQFLLRMSKRQGGLISLFNTVLSLIGEFVSRHFFSIALWLFLLFTVFQLAPDHYWYMFFYLFSIPYLLYGIYAFMRSLVRFNIANDYVLLSAEFQRRFVILVSVLLSVTTTIFLFRQAFVLGHYYQSELPIILLAINFIIFQISLIFFISKEQILRLIPTKNAFWYWVRMVVDNYFYLILLLTIAIIIMSNPYIGFGKFVLYFVSNFIYTVILIKFFMWLHEQVKRLASYVFFYSGEEIVRERFAYARTWFGLLIIVSFLIFTLCGVLISAKIWGMPILMRDFIDAFTKPILLEHTTSPLSIASLLQIVLYVIGGFLVAYAINHFVLDRIFDLLLVDAGVQHATVRLLQYVLVLIAITMGFISVGLETLIGWVIGGALLGIGWYIREPIGDFVAYFIILIQRPIKIGDYIKLEENAQGVVQRITARSVIIRRKNSTTIVIPNSQIIGRPIINWNYVRNFIAFDDIDIFVDYRENADVVRDILYQVVASHPQVLRNPKPVIRLDSFEERGYRFMVRGFVSSVYTLEMWNIASDVRLGILRSLRANNIRVALPVRIIVQDPYTIPQLRSESNSEPKFENQSFKD